MKDFYEHLEGTIKIVFSMTETSVYTTIMVNIITIILVCVGEGALRAPGGYFVQPACRGNNGQEYCGGETPGLQ